MAMTGKCVCGAVRYTIQTDKKEVGACHCEMCRAWSGGVFIGLQAAPRDVAWEGEENLTIYKSSPWAERAFCGTCGASMFYRVTAPGPHQGQLHIGAGTLDSYGDAKMTEEIFIDGKPAAYSFAGETRTMTAAEMMALFAPPDAGS